MNSERFIVKTQGIEQYERIAQWALENGYEWSSLGNAYDIHQPHIAFWPPERMIVRAHNSNFTKKIYNFEEFKNKFMNKNTFEVDKDFILKAYDAACADWKQKLKEKFSEVFPKNTSERVKTFEDVISILELKRQEYWIPYNNPSTPQEKSLNAQARLFKIAEAYNEGWKPNWDNSSEYKWFPYYYKSDGSWSVSHDGWPALLYFPSGLVFKSKELSIDAYNKFKDIFDDYFMVNS